MSRVLVDTGPLVALCDPSDGLHSRALKELDRLKGDLTVGLPALTEAFFLLPGAHLRARVVALFDRGLMKLEEPSNLEALSERTFKWLERYAEHQPDFADGWLVEWASAERLAVWTFDREFSTVWRTLKGKRVMLAP
jgi:uncharacterized protein